MARWKPNRLGLFNFWYHSDSVFEFADGKLFIRGLNGSGKTITTTMAIPVLIDGNKRSNRLDPMKSKDRHMSDLLLGEEAISGKKESIGYLYLEYTNGTDFITTGMGLRASRESHKVRPWYFIIYDNRRIGQQIQLYDEIWLGGEIRKEVKDKTAMKETLGPFTFFTEFQEEYLEEVGRKVYGFSSPDAFKDLVELLLNLRSPKLSRDLKPRVVNDIISNSLPELTEEDLSPLTETIENIDKHESRLKTIGNELGLLKDLNQAYDEYNEHLAYTIARETTQAMEKELNLQLELSNIEKEIREATMAMEIRDKGIHQIEGELKALQNKRIALKTHSVLEALHQKQDDLRKETDSVEFIVTQLRTKETIFQQVVKRRSDAEERTKKVGREIEELIEELGAIAKEINYWEHTPWSELFYSQMNQGISSFAAWNASIKERADEFRHIRDRISRLVMLSKDTTMKCDNMETAREAYEQAEKKIIELEEELESARTSFLKELMEWVDQHPQLEVTDMDKAVLRSIVSKIYDGQEQQQAFNSWKNQLYSVRELRVQEHLLETDIRLKQLTSEYAEMHAKKMELQSQEEVGPLLSEGEIAQEVALSKEGVPYIRLYEAVEWKPHVSIEVQQAMESAFVYTGLFSSFIVNENDQEAAFALASVIMRKPAEKHNAAEYLAPVPDGAITAETIHAVLESISVNVDTDSYILESGDFSGNWSRGASPAVDARYVGKEARRTQRDRLVSETGQVLSTLIEEISRVEHKKRELQLVREFIEAVYNTIPEPKQVAEQRILVQLEMTTAEALKKMYEGQKKIYEDAEKIYEDLKRDLQRDARDYPFPLEEALYSRLLERFEDYMLAQRDLQGSYTTYKAHQAVLASEQQMENMLFLDIGDLESRKIDADLAIQKLTLTVEALKTELAREGLDGLQKELEKIEQLISHCETTRLEYKEERGGCKKNKEMKEKDLPIAQSRVLHQMELVSGWQVQFSNEKKRGTIREDLSAPAVIKLLEEKHRGLQRMNLEKNLTDAYYRVQIKLREYKPELIFIGGANVDVCDRIEEVWASLAEKTSRFELTFTIDYKKTSPRVLLADREEQYINTERIIEEEEKELYKKVLIDDVGTIIVQRIQKVRDWTKIVNEKLAAMKTSVRVQLNWDPLPNKDGTLTTRQLIDLLSRDSNWIIDDDIKKLSRHFKSKIEDARVLAKEDQQVSLKQKIHEIMDYREWFEFKIMAQKDGDPEMTPLYDTRFNRFSNGEKAMSIYMPLFAAIAAKYEEASPTAPRIISLDEAFAGVDAENTAQLFKLASDLDFDYVMNAFGLWGCYESVDSLSIVEIKRPISSNTLALVRYYWNGKERYDLETGQLLENLVISR